MRYTEGAADLDRTLMALADPVRRTILRRLAQSEARVTDLAAEFPISLNSVSKHIRLLERAQLVERNIRGREHFLRFTPGPLDKAQQWIETQRAFWSSRLQAIDNLLAAEDSANAPSLSKETTDVGDS